MVTQQRITDGFVNHASQKPEQMAIAQGGWQCSYGDLLERVQWVATAISTHPQLWLHRTAPFSKTPVVALLLPNCPEFLEIFLGVSMAEGIVMVLNPDWAILQIQQILIRWQPDLLVTQPEQWQPLNDSLLAEQWQGRAIAPGAWAELSETQDSPSDWGKSEANPIFYIGFTSGTTGQPKGILRRHQSWIHSFAASRVEFGWRPGEAILVPGALVHSLSLYTAVEALVNGLTLHLLPQFSPKAVLHTLHHHAVPRLVAVPTLLQSITRVATRQHLICPEVQSVISAGSRLSAPLRQQINQTFPQAACLEYYGASELSFVSVAIASEPVPPGSVGRPFHGVTVSVQRDNGQGATAPGEVGWIGVTSEMVCSGYLEPVPDGSGFRIQQGWATVGDRGYVDEQGYLYLVGRERDMLISNGINVYPTEIEAVLTSLSEIAEAVVVGLPDDCRGDIICAVVQWQGAVQLSKSELMRHVQIHLGQHKCPRRWFVLEQFPLTASGKVARATLQVSILAGELVDAELR